MAVAPEQLSEIAGHRVEMPQMDMSDAMPLSAHRLHARRNRAVCRAPGYDQKVAVGIARGNQIRNILGYSLDLSCPEANHLFVVQRFVINVSGDVLLLDAADAVLQAGRSGNGP